MKIGIITFHNALNAGAVLQAYALQVLLTQQGHNVEFINYNPIKKYTFRNYVAKSPVVMFNKWRNIYNGKKYTKYGNFNKVLNLSSIRYLSYEELKESNLDYDIYIAGSDQIWNFYTSLSPVYMLDFVPNGKKKIAYAASMGQCRIDLSLYDDFRNKLMSFDAISLREKNGVDFVNALLKGEKIAYQTLDPTLMIDAKYYDKIIDKENFGDKHYICTYILAELDKENAEIIKSIKSSLKLDIINLRNPDTCIWLSHAHNKIVTPYQWLYFIKHSDFVICSSFHAVVFSLIFHKPFIALVPPNCKDKGGNMRINTLLKNMGLFNRIVEYFDQKRTQEILKESINWDDVDMKIRQLRNLSIEFLNNNLK
jgi:polysaccharide pyruvyl transferase WcaK-like protein